MRLVPPESLKSTRSGEAILKDGSQKQVTLHMLEGTAEQIRKQLFQSLDAFFELLPSEYERGSENTAREDFSEL